MKVAITGGTGFIGRALVAHLAAIGHECTVLTRHPQRATLPPGIAVRPVGALPECDAVIHLAGESVVGWWTPWKRRAILRSRIDGTRRLVEAMRALRTPPRVLLSASAVGYYGHRPGEFLDENSPPDPRARFRSQVCQAWEAEALRAEEMGVRVGLLRIGDVMALGGGFLGGLLPAYRAGGCRILGEPDSALPWIALDDAVRLIAFALESELRGPLNVVAPHAITQRTLATTLARRLGRCVRGRIPAGLLRCGLGEFSSALLDDQRVVPQRALDAGFHYTHPAWRSCLDALFA